MLQDLIENSAEEDCLGEHPKPASRDHLKTGQA
jgi:hypothetical protein